METLIVSVIVSVVSLAIYVTLTSGLKIWQKASRPIPEEDLCIFLDKFVQDARNCLLYGTMRFAGTGERVEIPTLVENAFSHERTVGMVVYRYEADQHRLVRQAKDYPDYFNSEEGQKPQYIDAVKSVQLRYYRYQKEGKRYLWQEGWTEEAYPLAVRLEIEFDNGSGVYSVVRTVSIPVAGSLASQ